MGQHDRAAQIGPWMDDGTGWSEAELAFRKGVALLGAAFICVLRAVDIVIEAWPLPTSRARK